MLLSVFALHGVLVCILSFLSFSRYSGFLFNGLDGANMLTNVAFQFAWTEPVAGFFANPLQGLSDIWFNFNAWASPGYVFPYLLFEQLDVGDPHFQVYVYTIHALILFVSVFIGMRSVELSWIAALVGAWASVLLMLPCFGVPILYPILQLQPNLAFTISETFLIIAAISMLGRNHGRIPVWRDAIAGAALLLLSAHLLLVSPTGIVLSLPILFFITVGLLVGAATRSERVIKIACITLVIAVLLLTGFGNFLLGIFKFTAAKFFSTDFKNDRASWYFVSILFQKEMHGIGGPVLAGSGIAGLVHASFSAHRRLLWVARSVLALVGLNLVLGALTVKYDFWHGPSPIYMEAMLWPIYATFAGYLAVLTTVARRGWLVGKDTPSIIANDSDKKNLVVLMVVPIVIVLLSFLKIPAKDGRDYPYPPSSSAIVEILKKNVRLRLGDTVRGRVATFMLQGKREPATWHDLHYADGLRVRNVGNDFHMVGLWYSGIPTLLEYSPTLSPPLFHVTKRLLARSEDKPLRSVLVLRHIDSTVLAALGVRYVITDAPISQSLRLVDTEKTQENETLYLYEVPRAILDASSPHKLELVHSFNAAMDRLADPQFDPHRSAVLMESDAEGVDLEGLSPAMDASVRLAKNGFDIRATSSGKSLLVLPLQFSHCLSFEEEHPHKHFEQLIRINALETGVLFNGELKGNLQYFTGPFNRSDCRLRDARDFEHVLALP